MNSRDQCRKPEKAARSRILYVDMGLLGNTV